jgi:hypothetical protein
MTDLVTDHLAITIAHLRDLGDRAAFEPHMHHKAADEIEQLDKACKEWAEVSQNNFQRAKAAQAALEEHKQGAMEAIRLVGQSARNAGLWQGKAEGLAIILTECINDLEQAINKKVHKESMEKLIAHARQAVDNLNK